MSEFYEHYETEAKCRALPQAAYWLDSFVCPNCGGATRATSECDELHYWQCGACDRQCSLISGTGFAAGERSLTCCFLAMQLLTQFKNSVSTSELMRPRTVWLVNGEIMEAMRVREDRHELDARVEIDTPCSKTDQDSPNTVPIVAERNTTPSGQPIFVHLRQKPFTTEDVAAFMAHIATSVNVVSHGRQPFTAPV